jgi:hypothetical protein
MLWTCFSNIFSQTNLIPRLAAQWNPLATATNNPAIAQLVEHLTVDCCSNQMVPGSIPGGRTLCPHP